MNEALAFEKQISMDMDILAGCTETGYSVNIF